MRSLGLRGKHFAGLGPVFRPLSHANFVREGLVRWIPVDRVFRITIGPKKSFSYRLSSAWPDGYGRALYWHGLKACEPETISVFLRLIRNARFFLDIGSHTGIYSLLACAVNPRLQVVAFEPVPEVRDALIRNLEINHFAGRCDVRSQALSDYSGSGQFHIPISRDMASLDPNGFCGLSGHIIDVQVATVDSLIEPATIVDFVKIDVEGFEDHVLRGMRRVLQESRPRIIFECLTQRLANRVVSVLRDYGYRFSRFGPHGLEQVPRVTPDPTHHFRNFLAEMHESNSD